MLVGEISSPPPIGDLHSIDAVEKFVAIGIHQTRSKKLRPSGREVKGADCNYASYCRCVGSVHVSNGKKKGEGNTKNGNRYLAWAYVEAANFAIRYCEPARKFYQRAQERQAQQHRCHQGSSAQASPRLLPHIKNRRAVLD